MSDPFSDVRQMTPAAQRRLGGYVRELLEIEAHLREAILIAGSAENPGVLAVISQTRAELISIHCRKYITMLSVDGRTAARQIAQMADQDIQTYIARAKAVLETQ